MSFKSTMRVALLKSLPEVRQTVVSHPYSHDICPRVEVVELGLPPGLSPEAFKDVWRNLSDPEFDLILDMREQRSGDPDLGKIIKANRLVSEAAAPVVWDLLEQLQRTCSTGEIQADIIDSAADAIITINEDHLIVGYNQGAATIFGFDRDEAIGADLNIIIPPPYKEKHREYVRRYIATRKPHLIGKHVQLNAIRKNGEEFPMSISFSVADIGGNLYFTGIVRDMSEYVAMEERLRQSERLAAVGNTISHIVHEIKNPLMIIGGFAQQLLKAGTLDAKGLQKLAIIAEEVSRLETLMAEMKDYSRPPALKRQSGEIAGLLQEVIQLYSENLKEKNITLSLEPPDPMPLCSLDYQQLKQVLMNLIKNASEAMPSGGRITITAHRRPPYFEIAVADTGEGMTSDVVEHIFTPYYTTKTKGSGLGLAISRNIVQAHNGNLEVVSQPGKGSVFTIKLPLVEIETGVCLR